MTSEKSESGEAKDRVTGSTIVAVNMHEFNLTNFNRFQ